MPTYTYFCEVHKEFEIQQSIKDPPLEECPQCSKAGIIEYHCPICDAKWIQEDDEFNFKTIKEPSITCISCATSKQNWDIGLEKRIPKPKRLISASNFILVGGGWASEGYK
jgi:predicted nucleic acid-binding Zn ribbon protein